MAHWRKSTRSPYWNLRASDLAGLPNGTSVSLAGLVICRQRPGTAKGHRFIPLEAETGIANIFVPRPTFQTHKFLITADPFLVHGHLQIGEGNVVSLYARRLEGLRRSADLGSLSHDFY